MRVARIVLFAGWLAVSFLAVAGFAAFSARDKTPAPPAVTVGNIGRTAGAAAALLFTGSSTPNSSFDFDSAVATAIAGRSTTPTTAAAPTVDTTAPAPSQVARSRTSGYMAESDVRALVTEFFTAEDVDRAFRIAWCESSFNANTVNPVTGAAGLFQIAPTDWARLSAAAGWTGSDILDPRANVAVAAWVAYNEPAAWSYWSCQG